MMYIKRIFIIGKIIWQACLYPLGGVFGALLPLPPFADGVFPVEAGATLSLAVAEAR